MIIFPIIIGVMMFILLVTWPVTVIFHELGHAIPALLLTGEKVTVYIGSYGDREKSRRLRIGKLEIYFRYNPLHWRQGICMPSAKHISVWKQAVYIIGGPLTSFVIIAIACYIAFAYDLHGAVKMIVVAFVPASVLGLLVSIIPNPTRIQLPDGRTTYNDAYLLKQLFRYKNLASDYNNIRQLFEAKEYKEAALIIDKILEKGHEDDSLYRAGIFTFMKLHDFAKAKELANAFVRLPAKSTDDFFFIAMAFSRSGDHAKGVKYYEKSVEQDKNNHNALNNMGYTLNLMERYEEAITCFDRAIEILPSLAYAYNNRGLAKIKLGKEEEGLNDINHSLSLDAQNSYAFRNLGIYHQDRGEKEKALELFLKAKDMDASTHLIDELITSAQTNPADPI